MHMMTNLYERYSVYSRQQRSVHYIHCDVAQVTDHPSRYPTTPVDIAAEPLSDAAPQLATSDGRNRRPVRMHRTAASTSAVRLSLL